MKARFLESFGFKFKHQNEQRDFQSVLTLMCAFLKVHPETSQGEVVNAECL